MNVFLHFQVKVQKVSCAYQKKLKCWKIILENYENIENNKKLGLYIGTQWFLKLGFRIQMNKYFAVKDEADETEEKNWEALLSSALALPRYVGIFVTQKTWEKNFYQSPGRQFLGIIFLYLVSPHTPSPEVSKHIPPPLVH